MSQRIDENNEDTCNPRISVFGSQQKNGRLQNRTFRRNISRKILRNTVCGKGCCKKGNSEHI